MSIIGNAAAGFAAMPFWQRAQRDYIAVDKVAESRREGIFQNLQENRWEIWVGGELVKHKGANEIPHEGALQAWVASDD